MHVEFTGRQTEVPARLRALAARKLGKLARVLRGISHVHVILSTDKHRQIAEVTVLSPRLALAAQEESADLALSLSTVMDKLARQAQRHVAKRRERKRRAPGRAILAAEAMATARAGNGARRGSRRAQGRLRLVEPGPPVTARARRRRARA